MKPKGRPKKQRVIKTEPKIKLFSPRGKPGRSDEVQLTLDEFEAIRLVDFQGLSQQEAANSMGISQQTLSRVIRKARKTLANALILGKIIKINPQE